MSTESAEAAAAGTMMCCASCGIAEVDDIKLKMCGGGCDLVKYCSDKCQKNHREQHEEECKKRVDELRDDDLFTQPDSCHLGDCPICCLPQLLGMGKSAIMPCCGKSICMGCQYYNMIREMMAGLENRCVYCREPLPETDEEGLKMVMKRVKTNDPVAMCQMGKQHYNEGDYVDATKYWTQAAELGYANAHYNLSLMYSDGEDVEKDEKKAIYHLEEAAMAGHPTARYNLGCFDARNGSFERAKKHFIITANLGCHDSLKELKKLHADGHASKEEYAGALRAYQAAVDARKSLEREEAANFIET